jgi:ribosomal RNA-processing protein 36
LKKEEKEKVKLGKKPFFVKEAAVRERELELKFADLKAAGGVQKFIEKRRKRHASKDRRLLPNRRPYE